MSERPASLLTKTQRRRLRENFDGVDGAKRRRDERQIRQRIAAGIDDFELIVEQPDRQFELAFEDPPADEFAETLGATYLTLERLRVLGNVDRESVLENAAERADGLAARDDFGSVVDAELTRDEADHAAAETETGPDRYEPTRWKWLSDILLKCSLLGFVPALLVSLTMPTLSDGPIGGTLVFIGLLALAGALVIVALRTVKYDVIPFVRTLVADPRAIVSSIRNSI